MSSYVTEIDGCRRRVIVNDNGDATAVTINDRKLAAQHVWLDSSGQNLHLLIGGRSYDIRIDEDEDGLLLTYAGWRYRGTANDERQAELLKQIGKSGAASGPTKIKAPMPGLVVKVLISPGESVVRGQRLLVLEAMKMENDVKAPRDGTVSAISVKVGQPVELGTELLIIK